MGVLFYDPHTGRLPSLRSVSSLVHRVPAPLRAIDLGCVNPAHLSLARRTLNRGQPPLVKRPRYVSALRANRPAGRVSLIRLCCCCGNHAHNDTG